MRMDKLKNFQKSKSDCLSRVDLSRKGSIDEPIKDLVEILNSSLHYYTTSTCSGRITLIEKPSEDAGRKKGNIIHLNSHELLDINELASALQAYNLRTTSDRNIEQSCLWLKFEPFILHVQCFDLSKAKDLLDIALAIGCRNSGITLGKGGRFMVAVRSTSTLEVPLSCDNQFEDLKLDYIRFLWIDCNRRLEQNFLRLNRFKSGLEKILRTSLKT